MALREEAGTAGENPSPGRKILGFEGNVFFTGLVSFFMDLSSEMVYPLIPLFLASVLGVGASAIGLIEGVAESTASLLQAFSGWVSDRLGRRKPLMLLGYGVSALSRPGLALAGGWGHVLAARFVDRFGKGVRTAPRDAIVAECSTSADLGRNFGFQRALDQLGAVAGPAVAAGILFLRPGAVRTVFWVSLIPAVVCVLVIVFFVRERRPRAGPGAPETGSEVGPGAGAGAEAPAASLQVQAGPRLADLWQRPVLVRYVLISGLFALGNSSNAFLILRAQNLGVATLALPFMYLVFNLVYSALSIPAGLLADRLGRRRLMLAGFLVFALVYLGMALARTQAAAWGLFALYGVYMGIADGNGRALLAELAPARLKATAFGAYHGLVGLAAFPASLIAGIMWDRVSPAAPFWLGAGGAVLAGVLLWALVPEPGRERRIA